MYGPHQLPAQKGAFYAACTLLLAGSCRALAGLITTSLIPNDSPSFFVVQASNAYGLDLRDLSSG